MAIRSNPNRLVEVTEEGQAKFIAELFGTSNDDKPTSGYCNGTTFLEVDTGKIYLFNEDTSSWVEVQ